MGGIADAEHARLPPLLQAIHANRQQLEVVHGPELADTVGKGGHQP